MQSVRKLVTIAVAMTASPFLLGQASAQTSVWDHNGSLMRLEEKAKKRRFIYEEPRESLLGAGVKNGTVLFDGEEKSDGRLAGYAKLFRKGCGPIDYFVEGPYDKAKGEILLQGQAPIYSGNGCKITGYSDDGSASSLRFTLQSAPESEVASAPEAGSGDPEPRPSYLPPLADDRAEREPAQPDYRGGRFNQQDEAERDYSSRDYAYRRERFERGSRYDGSYYSGPGFRDDPDDDYYDYDEDDGPAYIPYQPRWRRFRY